MSFPVVGRKKPNTISLPSDAKVVAKLRAKLNEYEQHLKDETDSSYRDTAWHCIAAIAVLKTLLEEGRAEFDAVRVSIVLEHGENVGPVNRLRNAFYAVEDYCINDGINVRFGTGF